MGVINAKMDKANMVFILLRADIYTTALGVCERR